MALDTSSSSRSVAGTMRSDVAALLWKGQASAMHQYGIERLSPAATAKIDDLRVPHEGLLASTFAVITHVLRARRCSLMLLDDDQHLVVSKSHGLGPEVVAGTRLAIGERIAGQVAATRKPLLITNAGMTVPEVNYGNYATRSFISVPISSGNKLYGVLNAADKTGDIPFDEFDLTTLTLLAQHVASCIENAELHQRIARLANTDGLTGLHNHRYFQERLDEELKRAQRFGLTVSLLMADLDSFKEFNDQHGHPAGDVILEQVAQVLHNTVRPSDVVSRYGGDEFAIIAPETDAAGAATLARRLARALARHRYLTPGPDATLEVRLSIGISSFPAPAGSQTDIIAQADQAMYQAKQSRQTVAIWRKASTPRMRAARSACTSTALHLSWNGR
ncbi:MAG: sensor domain-containing diguanylate cyclase [Chloroflexota bacterium]|nr:MAG: sensor domain-containing diguanylate cyclase [Chloroflexota bacterium]